MTVSEQQQQREFQRERLVNTAMTVNFAARSIKVATELPFEQCIELVKAAAIINALGDIGSQINATV